MGLIGPLAVMTAWAAGAETPPPQAIAQAKGTVPIALETHADPFDYRSAVSPVLHLPLPRARQHWRLCAVFPHIKDEYWLSVAYGMAQEARRLDVALTISETGGYRSVDAQGARLRGCVGKADAAILGTVSFDSPQIAAAIADVSDEMPVIAAVNDVASRAVAVKVGVSWREMGGHVGRYLAAEYGPRQAAQQAVLATGPREAGWVSFLSEGLAAALAHSGLSLVETGWADTGTQEQLRLAEDLLDRHPDIPVFIGSAPAVESVVSLLRSEGRLGAMRLVATYYTQAIRRGMMRGRIDAAPFDDPAMQGRLAIEYAVRAIEGTVDHRQIGPVIRLVTRTSLPPADALAPAGFRPEFVIP